MFKKNKGVIAAGVAAFMMIAGSRPLWADPTTMPAELAGKTIINVRDAGAKGDGTTDDQAALVKALAQARGQAGTVVFAPAGTYNHSGQLDVDGTTLAGVGPATIFVATQPAASAINLKGDHPRVTYLKLVSNVGDLPRLQSSASAMVVVRKATHFKVDHVIITSGLSSGILNLGGSGTADEPAVISDNDISATHADGIHNTQQAHNILITHNRVANNGDDMIAIVSYEKDGGLCSDIEIAENELDGNYHGRGITVVGGRNVTIHNNRVSNSNAAGFYFESEASYKTLGVDNVVAQDNDISNSCQPPCQSSHAGILVGGRPEYPVVNVQILNNRITNSTKDGIFLGKNVVGAVVSGNTISGTGKFGIEMNGASSPSLHDNHISGCAKDSIKTIVSR